MLTEEAWLDLDAEAGFRHSYAGQAAPAEALRELLAFRLADEEYALDVAAIEEIIKPRPVTEVPLTPPFVTGLISLRGRIVPILDLRRRLGLAAEPLGRASRIVVAADRGRVVGLQVDAVTGVVRLSAADIGPTPAVVGGVDGEFLEGLGRVGGRLVILLNFPRILEFSLDDGGAGA